MTDSLLQDLVALLDSIKTFIANDTDMSWTRYGYVTTLQYELRAYMDELSVGKMDCLEKLNLLFAPTGSLQEHAISNGWTDEYLQLSVMFDKIYLKL